MPRDYIDIGPVPAEEDCAQVGQPDYATRARAEYAFKCDNEAPARWDDVPANAGVQDTEEELRRDQIAYVAELPNCDLCHKTAEYDAKTKMGPWAYLCTDCWGTHTYGELGTGKGQKLRVRG